MKVFAKLIREGTALDATGASVTTVTLQVDAGDTIFAFKMRLRHHLRQLEDAGSAGGMPSDTGKLMAAMATDGAPAEFLYKDGDVELIATIGDLADLVATGSIKNETIVTYEGMAEWVAFSMLRQRWLEPAKPSEFARLLFVLDAARCD